MKVCSMKVSLMSGLRYVEKRAERQVDLLCIAHNDKGRGVVE
jgi:hypothetical protein